MKVYAVVVTYNRLNLLKKAIDGLRGQSKPIDTLLVVNNGSTDGTKEWLDLQRGIKVITQENIGGSGGFWRGIKEAYEAGADYIWCMDDDVHPYENCLEELLKMMPNKGGIVAPLRLYNEQEVAIGETKHFNLDKPFRKLKEDITQNDIQKSKGKPINVEAISFEGPLISRSVVDRIGLPEKNMFIFWDDTVYSYRAYNAKFPILLVPKARLYKEDLRVTGKNNEIRSWKYPYMLRNMTFFVTENAKGICKKIIFCKIFAIYFGGVCLHLLKGDHKYTIHDIDAVKEAFFDGVKGTLGKY
jgi:GT2 family glycosyltransferase